MRILSIFVMTSYGATIASVHQAAWFFQTSYKNSHLAYLDSPVAQRFISQLTFDKVTQLRNKDDFFYLRKVSPTDNRSLVCVTDQAIADTRSVDDLLESIQQSVGNVHDLSGIQEKEKCILALKKIMNNPNFALEQSPSQPIVEEKPKATPGISFFGPKDLPKFNDPDDWLSLDYTHKRGLYEMD